MTRSHRKDKTVASLVAAERKARADLDGAVLAKAVQSPESKPWASQLQALAGKLAGLEKKMEEIQAQIAELKEQQRPLSRKLTPLRAKLRTTDPDVIKLDMSWRQANEKLETALDQKLMSDPTGAKLIAERDRLKAERQKLAPTRKPRGSRKPQAAAAQ